VRMEGLGQLKKIHLIKTQTCDLPGLNPMFKEIHKVQIFLYFNKKYKSDAYMLSINVHNTQCLEVLNAIFFKYFHYTMYFPGFYFFSSM
jgi:hypothetical protein